jgi:hypothetical protein
MSWRDRFKAGDASVSRADAARSALSASTVTTWADADIGAIRAATSAVAGQAIDLSYITDAYMAACLDAPYSSEGGQEFEGAQANVIVAMYSGPPLGNDHRYVWYGHRAALLYDGDLESWFSQSVTFEDGEFKRGTQLFRHYGQATIVSSFDDGSPLWEFRI